MDKSAIENKIDALAEKMEADIFAYCGGIFSEGYDLLLGEFKNRKLRKNILFILNTYGGDLNVGYKIARFLQDAYRTYSSLHNEGEQGKFTIFINGPCKSSGTLICLGADAIIMSNQGELGPIDIQLRKLDEVGERTSGLTPIQAVQFLETQSVNLFKSHFINLRFSDNLGFSTKMAAEVAAKLTIGLLAPIYEQIDPIRLAEVHRFVSISAEYGRRLINDNLHEGALEQLLMRYPSHGFIIDRKEAAGIFKEIEVPSIELQEIGDFLKEIFDASMQKDDYFVRFLSSLSESSRKCSSAKEEVSSV